MGRNEREGRKGGEGRGGEGRRGEGGGRGKEEEEEGKSTQIMKAIACTEALPPGGGNKLNQESGRRLP